jgi:hypothetical protein
VKLAIEFIASVLVVGLVWIYFGVAFAYGDSGGEVPTPVTVACAGVVAAIGFAAAIMTHHFPWVALLVSSVGIVAFFSLTGASPVGLALTRVRSAGFRRRSDARNSMEAEQKKRFDGTRKAEMTLGSAGLAARATRIS